MISYQYLGGWDKTLDVLANQLDLRMTIASTKRMIETIISSYDADDCLFGLFSAATTALGKLSPFVSTHDYCIKIQNYNEHGINLSVSPIYLLGPEYPEQYRQKHGKELDEKAIIGLIEIVTEDQLHHDHKTFHLGIDAGVVFKNAKISYNKNLFLELIKVENGIMAKLVCDAQVTSKKFTWETLGVVADDFQTKSNSRAALTSSNLPTDKR